MEELDSFTLNCRPAEASATCASPPQLRKMTSQTDSHHDKHLPAHPDSSRRAEQTGSGRILQWLWRMLPDGALPLGCASFSPSVWCLRGGSVERSSASISLRCPERAQRYPAKCDAMALSGEGTRFVVGPGVRRTTLDRHQSRVRQQRGVGAVSGAIGGSP